MRLRQRCLVLAAAATTFLAGSALGASAGIQPLPFTTARALATALTHAATTRILPALVVPLSAIAKQEFPPRRSCEVSSSTTAANPFTEWPGDAKCSFGDVGAKRTVVLYGNSHAGVLLDVLDQLGRADHVRVILLALSGCQVAATSHWNWTTETPYFGCDAFRSSTLANIRALHPAAVIVADDAGAYNYSSAKVLISSKSYLAAERATVHALHSSGATVVVLGDTPELLNVYPHINPVACLARNPTSIERCAAQRATVDGLLLPGEAGAVIAGGGSFLPQTDWFCTATTCPLVIDHTVAYFDGHHASLAYYRLLAPLLQAKLHALHVL